MSAVLKFTNAWGEVYWFQGIGACWPYAPERRLIARTTPDRSQARVFDTEEQAQETLVAAGGPTGWTVESTGEPALNYTDELRAEDRAARVPDLHAEADRRDRSGPR